MPKHERLSDDELRSLIANQITSATNYTDGPLADNRRTSLRYYKGMPYGDEEEGRSKIVTSEVSDAVEGMMPQLIKLFCSTDDAVAYKPTDPQHDKFAEQATEYGNYIFNVDNNGFRIFYDAFKDALLFRNCAAKIWWEEKRITTPEYYKGLIEDELTLLVENDDVEILEQEARQIDIIDAETMQQSVVTVYDVAVRRTKMQGRVCIDLIPPEELLLRPRLVDIETTSCISHRTLKAISDLVEQGYDLDVLEEIADGEFGDSGMERIERFRNDGEGFAWFSGDHYKTREVWIVETFIAVDVNGDGEAERLKCVTNHDGSRWLTKKGKICKEEWTGPWPIVGGTAIMMPHKWHGRSWADMTMDLQRINSTVTRQLLDNIYSINNNRLLAVDTKVNLDDLLTNRPNQVIRMREQGALQPLTVQPIIGEILPVLQYLRDIGENRHGITRYNQGLDSDSLNKTKGGMSMIMTASQERVMLAARVLAETFVKPLFRRILYLICQHQREPRMVKLTRGWVSMNPREWSDQMEVITQVGLGTGNKEEMRQSLMMLTGYQMQAMQAQAPIVTWQNIYNTAKKITENVGFRDVENFWTDPSTVPPQPPQEGQDPQLQAVMAGAQAQVASAQIRAQQQAQSDAMKQQDAAGKSQIDAHLEMERIASQERIAEQDRLSKERIAMAQLERDLRQMEMGAMQHAEARQDKAMIAEQPKTNGEDKNGHSEHMLSMMEMMRQHMEALNKNMSLPREVVRGKDGKIAGVRTMMIEDKPNG